MPWKETFLNGKSWHRVFKFLMASVLVGAEEFLVEVEVDPPDAIRPDAIKKTKSGIGYEAYADGTYIEYFSQTHQKWLLGLPRHN